MSSCPKCGHKLHIYNISQYCPKCKVNMRFVNFEENFIREAKQAELSQALVHVKVRRVKSALIGSKLCIARLCVMLLPLLSMLIPAGSFTFNIPFVTGVEGQVSTFDFSVLGVYNLFSGSTFGYINTMTGSEFVGADFVLLKTTLFVFLSVAVFALLVFFTSLLCFISCKKMQKITCAVAALGIVDAVIAIVFMARFSAGVSTPIISIKNGFGLYVTILMFAVVFSISFILSKKGINIEYDEGMVKRAEIARKVKRGEIDIDSLPQPVVETAATRKIDEEIAKEEASLNEKYGSSNAEAEK